MKQTVQIVSAPSILGLRPSGVEQLPESLIKAGLIAKTDAMEAITEVPTFNHVYNREREPSTNCLNTAAIRAFSLTLMEVVERQLDQPVFPLILGGDCSILIGIMPALKKKGSYGLVFLDAHADFYQPAASTTGELADMDLAIVTGRGPEIVTDLGHLRPYVAERHVIHIGQRDAAETTIYGSQDIADSDIKRFDLATIRTKGVEDIIKAVIDYMGTLRIDGFWVHFDTDVINDEENPAVDYRLPGGLSFEETAYLLKALIQTGKTTGLSVTIFNPALDAEGGIAAKIADCLAFAFRDA